MDMVTLDVADGLKVHGLGKGVPPRNALCLEGWLETLFDFLENIVWDNGCSAYPLQCYTTKDARKVHGLVDKQ
jgi:hypothetical protein